MRAILGISSAAVSKLVSNPKHPVLTLCLRGMQLGCQQVANQQEETEARSATKLTAPYRSQLRCLVGLCSPVLSGYQPARPAARAASALQPETSRPFPASQQRQHGPYHVCDGLCGQRFHQRLYTLASLWLYTWLHSAFILFVLFVLVPSVEDVLFASPSLNPALSAKFTSSTGLQEGGCGEKTAGLASTSGSLGALLPRNQQRRSKKGIAKYGKRAAERQNMRTQRAAERRLHKIMTKQLLEYVYIGNQKGDRMLFNINVPPDRIRKLFKKSGF